MKVLILAGGQGTRIRALFPDGPKGLIPIRGKPFLQWRIEQLIDQGFGEFVLCLGYRSEQIRDYFGDGTMWNVRVEYSLEVEPMGTAGALRVAAPFLRETALVVNGDTYLAIDHRVLVAAHREQRRRGGVLGTLALVTVPDSGQYGQVMIDSHQRIIAFREKQPSPAGAGLINAGAYVLEPEVLHAIPSGRAVSIEQETFPALAAERALCGVPLEGAFADVGTPEGYASAAPLLR
jgi:NDP-sugar pyrophosphorylase family protein